MGRTRGRVLPLFEGGFIQSSEVVPAFANTAIVVATSCDSAISELKDKSAVIRVVVVPGANSEYPTLSIFPVSGADNIKPILCNPPVDVEGSAALLGIPTGLLRLLRESGC